MFSALGIERPYTSDMEQLFLGEKPKRKKIPVTSFFFPSQNFRIVHLNFTIRINHSVVRGARVYERMSMCMCVCVCVGLCVCMRERVVDYPHYTSAQPNVDMVTAVYAKGE